MYKENKYEYENKYENKENQNLRHEREKIRIYLTREKKSTEKYGKYVAIKIYVMIESEKISEHVQLKKRAF